ncbi:glycoside hydrolase [Curvularia clavata]|uniref:Glycoside hydrolase n=1 Tax=Curvularia clavata TaxID=95742 RepID=A0A9Q8ZGQ9_CURCL|nr:glycoside hydrolase [Curvularia clavata]
MIWSIDFDATVGGGGDANSTINDNLVWIDPKIWETPTPNVQCFFPCTLVLPLLPTETLTTIDYPRIPITVADSIQSTLAFSPITVTEYALSTMAIPTGQAQPKLSTTTAWPQSTWTDDLGQSYSTQPTGATINFPPRDYQLAYMPTLHVRNGVPSPTVSKCAFPALSCPTSESSSLGNALWGSLAKRPVRKSPSPNNIQLHFWEGPLETPDEEEAEPEQCNIKQEEHEDDNQDDSGEPDVPEPGAEPPVFPKDPKPGCYNKGNPGNRASLVKVIDETCNDIDFSLSVRKETDLEPGISKNTLRVNSTNPYLKDAVYMEYNVWVQIKEGCLWKNFDFYECARQFKYIVDKCDTKGENNKHGGILEGNCVKWRIDVGFGHNLLQ